MLSRISLVFLSLMVVSPAAVAGPRADCSSLVVNRTYANQFSGFLNVPVYFANFGMPGPTGVNVVPNAGLGTMTFRPGGRMTNTETLAIGLLGLKKDLVIKGSYALTWDTSHDPAVCSGTLQGSSDDGTPYNFAVTVSPEGQRVMMTHTDKGLMVELAMTRIERGRCRNDVLEGAYSINAQGWVLGATVGAPSEQQFGGYVVSTSMGAIRFRPYTFHAGFPDAPLGAGWLDEFDTQSLNGQIISRTATGWYKINPDCTGVMTLRDSKGTSDSHFELIAGKDGEVVYAVAIDTVSVSGAAVLPNILGMTLVHMNDSQR